MRDSDFFDLTVSDSLRTIKAIQIRLHLLEGSCATQTAVASQIELYDVLLNELGEIHRNLANHFEHGREIPRASGRAVLNA